MQIKGLITKSCFLCFLLEPLKGLCMHEGELNQDWCVSVCIPLPPLFPMPSPQQGTDHLVSLVGDSWLAGYLLTHLGISPKLKPSSQVLKKNIQVPTHALNCVNKNNSFLPLYLSKNDCLPYWRPKHKLCFSQIKGIELNRAAK